MSTTPADTTRLAFGLLNSSFALGGSPTMLISRMSNEGLVFTPNVVESPELNGSGQTVDQIVTGGSSAGPVDFPLIRSNWFHAMLESVFRNSFGTGTVSDETSPGVYSSPRAVAANELIPAKVVKLWGVEKKFDSPDTPSYQLFSRVGVNTMSLRVQPNEILSGQVGLVGGLMTLPSSDVSGATYPDPGDYKAYTSQNTTVVSIGSASTEQCFNTITLNFNSNLRAIDCVGRADPKTRGLGRFQAMIEGTAYFTSNDLLTELLSQAEFPITLTLSDGSGNSYSFFYPRCKTVSAPVSTPGMNTDVVVPVSFRALYHKNLGYSVMCTRTLA